MNYTGEARAKQETTEDAPTVTQVLEWMRTYKENKLTADALQREYQRGVSAGNLCAGYGIEATMPKGNDGHSDPVAKAVIDREQLCEELDVSERQVRYLQHRWHRITSETHAIVFHHRLEGYAIEEIQASVGKSRRQVYRYLRECAEQIKGEG